MVTNVNTFGDGEDISNQSLVKHTRSNLVRNALIKLILTNKPILKSQHYKRGKT